MGCNTSLPDNDYFEDKEWEDQMRENVNYLSGPDNAKLSGSLKSFLFWSEGLDKNLFLTSQELGLIPALIQTLVNREIDEAHRAFAYIAIDCIYNLASFSQNYSYLTAVSTGLISCLSNLVSFNNLLAADLNMANMALLTLANMLMHNGYNNDDTIAETQMHMYQQRDHLKILRTMYEANSLLISDLTEVNLDAKQKALLVDIRIGSANIIANLMKNKAIRIDVISATDALGDGSHLEIIASDDILAVLYQVIKFDTVNNEARHYAFDALHLLSSIDSNLQYFSKNKNLVQLLRTITRADSYSADKARRILDHLGHLVQCNCPGCIEPMHNIIDRLYKNVTHALTDFSKI